MQAYICDRCDRVIRKEDDLYGVSIMKMEQEPCDRLQEAGKVDFCAMCAGSIIDYVLRSHGKEPVGAVDSGLREPDPDPVGEAAPEQGDEKPRQRIEVDIGKVLALKAAGWKVKDIAGDMGIGVSTVYAVLKARDKEAGNGIRTSMDKRGSKSP